MSVLSWAFAFLPSFRSLRGTHTRDCKSKAAPFRIFAQVVQKKGHRTPLIRPRWNLRLKPKQSSFYWFSIIIESTPDLRSNCPAICGWWAGGGGFYFDFILVLAGFRSCILLESNGCILILLEWERNAIKISFYSSSISTCEFAGDFRRCPFAFVAHIFHWPTRWFRLLNSEMSNPLCTGPPHSIDFGWKQFGKSIRWLASRPMKIQFITALNIYRSAFLSAIHRVTTWRIRIWFAHMRRVYSNIRMYVPLHLVPRRTAINERLHRPFDT